MNILVTGANGQLGSGLRELAPAKKWNFIFTDVDELDITKNEEVAAFFNKFSVDCCINCAAYTQVDKAESEAEQARLINSTAVRNLAAACNQHNAALIHISTDFVFDGKNNLPYRETDTPSPLSVYGRTKLEGEQAAASCGRAVIVRTSWLYYERGKNFVDTMLRLGKEREELRVVFDQTGTPTWAGDLAAAILDIVEKFAETPDSVGKLKGTYHYSNEGIASWYDFAFEIFRLSGLDADLLPVRTDEYPTPATRPAYSVLDKAKIKKTFGLKIPHWKSSLEICLKSWNESS